MTFKNIAAIAAASALALSATAAQASVHALSLTKAPQADAVRTGAKLRKSNKAVVPFTPLVIVGGVLATVAVLEITGAVNIFGDDEPESP